MNCLGQQAFCVIIYILAHLDLTIRMGKYLFGARMKPLDLTGQRFGSLTAIRFSHSFRRNNGQLHRVWECACDCGKIIKVDVVTLRQGERRSCGCSRKKLRVTDEQLLSNKLYAYYKMGAENRNLEFSITKEQLFNLSQQNCYYCGSSPDKTYTESRTKRKSALYNGIDRVDNSRGYVLDNCVPCCKTCNYAKRNYSIQYFIDWIKRVHTNLSNKGTIQD